jgi:hypothetical protein
MTVETSQELEIAIRKQTRLKDSKLLEEMAQRRECRCPSPDAPEHYPDCAKGALLSGARMLALMAED